MVDIQKGKNVNGNMYQGCNFYQSASDLEEITKLINEKKYVEVAAFIKSRKNQIGALHPLYPNFTIDFKKSGENIVLCSTPLSEEAAKKYPSTLKGRFTLNEKYKGFDSIEEILDHSYESQKDIEINMIALKKMLGDVEDPIQGEVQTLVNKDSRFVIKHPEFPEAKPFRIFLDGYTESYDYILLRIYKLKLSNFICMSNKDQNSDVTFDIKFNLYDKSVDLTTSINPNKSVSHKAKLKFLRFFQNIILKKKLTIMALEEEEILSEGVLDNFHYNGAFKDAENEAEFLETIILIENKFNKSIIIPQIIEDSDLDAVNYLSRAIKYGKVIGTWRSVDVIITMDSKGNSNLMDFEKDLNDLLYVFSMDIDVFGEVIHIPQVKRKLINPILPNKELKKIHRSTKKGLTDGDVLTVRLVAGKDNAFEDTFSLDCADDNYILLPSR